MVDINFTFSRDELTKAYASHPDEKWRLLLYLVFGSIFLLIGILGFVFDNSEEGMTFYIVLTGGLYFIFSIFSRKIAYRKVYDSHIILREEIYYTFSYKSFKTSGNNYNNEIGWSIVHKVMENSDFFYIYISKDMHHIVPKRALTTEKIQTFKEILKSQKDLRRE